MIIKYKGREWERRESIGKTDKNWSSEVEVIEFLFAFIRLIKPAVIYEIGTFEGVTAIEMGKACYLNNFGKVYTYDINDYNQIRNITMMNLSDIIQVGFRKDLKIEKPVDLLFIDGEHSYKGVKKDLVDFRNHMASNSFIILHDTSPEYSLSDGINKAINEFLQIEKYIKLYLDSPQGLTILQKVN